MKARFCGFVLSLVCFRLLVIAYAGAALGSLSHEQSAVVYAMAGIIGHMSGVAVDLAVREYRRRASNPVLN
jgi:hypothetical protein